MLGQSASRRHADSALLQPLPSSFDLIYPVAGTYAFL